MKNKFKNVVIFGASKGIGNALAKQYAANGSNLVLLSKNETGIRELTGILNSQGYVCSYKRCDVAVKEEVRYGIEYAAVKLNSIDLVIFNSGIGGPNWMDNFSSGEFKNTFSVNTFGIAYMLEYIIPVMKSQAKSGNYGTIAGVTSLADIRGYAGSSSYSASKAAASILLEAARVELKKYNIKVITVRPGFVKTEMTDKNEFHMPLLMQPEEAAKIIYKGIERGKSIVQFPWPIVLATRFIKFLPNCIYDRAMTTARPKSGKKK